MEGQQRRTAGRRMAESTEVGDARAKLIEKVRDLADLRADTE